MFDTEDWSPSYMAAFVSGMGIDIMNYTLNHPDFKKFLNSGEKFDAIIIELFVSESLLGLGKHFNCPVIGLSTFSSSKWTNDLTGNPSPYSYVPHNFIEYTDKMNFYQRLHNTLLSLFENLYYEYIHYPTQVSDV
jgi:hypothetical protein